MSRPIIPMAGKVFGKLTILKLLPKTWQGSGKAARWLALCECGKKKIVLGAVLRRGGITAGAEGCGCWKGAWRSDVDINIKHGCARVGKHTKTYNTWTQMRYRCGHCKNYYDRGIRVCKRWNKFENFLRDMGEKPKGLTLDRVNNDGNYTPKNCRWASYSQQNSNRRKYKKGVGGNVQDSETKYEKEARRAS